ncbi:MAG: Fic family protein [Planctomycetota bacterium]
MKLPQTPPNQPYSQLFLESGPEDQYGKALRAGIAHFQHQPYEHWDKLQWRQPPEGLSREQWWHGIKFARSLNRKATPLLDSQGQAFSYVIVDAMSEAQHKTDLALGGDIALDEPVTNPATRDRYLVSSLIQEAITSSEIEGAVVTRERAKEMLRSDQKPRSHDERMILNNYQTMGWLKTVKDKAMSPELVKEIQRRMTEGTLDDPEDAGRFRTPDRQVDIADIYGEVAFTPPPAKELEKRIVRLCEFANGQTPDRFVHPLVRSIVLHFWLAHDHPFVDGNGRTARALFYWSMLKHGYWLFEYISISQVILESSKDYYLAFLHTETDDNDLTYFIIQQLDVIEKATQKLHEYVKEKTAQNRQLEALLHGKTDLNHRQRAMLGHALRHPHKAYDTESHQTSHRVSYQTARTDLTNLVTRGLVTQNRRGRTDFFTPVADLANKLRQMS